ncbi:hypothetical protein BVX94_00350 [bacterium B17]|nr:hypothetical protein BVX94_00350 [bacterium B17]
MRFLLPVFRQTFQLGFQLLQAFLLLQPQYTPLLPAITRCYPSLAKNLLWFSLVVKENTRFRPPGRAHQRAEQYQKTGVKQVKNEKNMSKT